VSGIMEAAAGELCGAERGDARLGALGDAGCVDVAVAANRAETLNRVAGLSLSV
jgi:hypothetical protein